MNESWPQPRTARLALGLLALAETVYALLCPGPLLVGSFVLCAWLWVLARWEII